MMSHDAQKVHVFKKKKNPILFLIKNIFTKGLAIARMTDRRWNLFGCDSNQ